MAMILEKRLTKTALEAACERDGEEAAAPPDILSVMTTRFGKLEVEADLILTFPEGLIGFERCQHYLVVRHDEASAFRWLQSLEEPALAFPIVEPREFRPDYAPTISDNDARSLGLTPDLPVLVFAIVTVPPQNPRAMTANLLGPLVINVLTRQGKQVIVQDDQYTTRHEVVQELLRSANVAVTPADAPEPVSEPSVSESSKASRAA